jgi:pimeloyl-ACP methyl ester carboxylesterase
MAHGSFTPPSRLLLSLESMAWWERGTFTVAADRLIPPCTNEASPVLVLPGFTASDRSTKPLRALLRRKHYPVHGWALGANVGPHPHVVDGMQRRLVNLAERYGAPVSVVGWSLGGIYARELGWSHPEHVRMVITLGSPYRFRKGDRGHTSELYDALAPQHEPFAGRLLPEEDRPPLPVPATSIYSMSDGIVRWQACIEPVGPRRENIAVLATHNGLAFNAGALYAVADRINQPIGTWAPFVAPLHLRQLFPRASRGGGHRTTP